MPEKNGYTSRGNKSRYWSEEQVHEACKIIEQQGGVPTIVSVRQLLGIEKGSNSTVQRYIISYQKSKVITSNIPKSPPLPASIKTTLESLWDSALSHAYQRVKAQEESLSYQESCLEQERLACVQVLIRSEHELVEEQQLNQHLQSSIAALTEALTMLSADMKRLADEKNRAEADRIEAEHQAQRSKAKYEQAKAEVRCLISKQDPGFY